MKVHAARAGLAAAYAVPLWYLWTRAPFEGFLPPAVLGARVDLVLLAGLAALALVTAYRPGRGSPLPVLAGTASALLLVLLYAHSRLDWSRLLKDWGLVTDPVPLPLALALTAVPFAAAWTLHALHLRERLTARYAGKGVPAKEVEFAALGVTQHAVRAALAALGVTGGVTLAYVALEPVTRVLAASARPLAFLGPVLAAGAIVLVLWWLIRRERVDA